MWNYQNDDKLIFRVEITFISRVIPISAKESANILWMTGYYRTAGCITLHIYIVLPFVCVFGIELKYKTKNEKPLKIVSKALAAWYGLLGINVKGQTHKAEFIHTSAAITNINADPDNKYARCKWVI